MVKKLLFALSLVLLVSNLAAQVKQLQLKNDVKPETAKFSAANANSFQVKISLDKLSWKSKKAKTGEFFSKLWFDKGYSSGEVGSPELPAYKKLILLPYGATATAKVVNYTQTEYILKDIGMENPIFPVQPSVRKDQDSASIPFHYKKEIYSKQSYLRNSLVSLEILGNMRSYTVARLVVTPVDYNPSQKSIKVYNDIDIQITVGGSTKSNKELQNLSSPYFDIIGQSAFNATENPYDQHPDLTKYPVKMVIISNRMFESSLAPYIAWKTQKGFNVVTAYTDEIGSTSSQIKAYIQQQYNAATEDDPAPTFLLLVGDVAQVPSSAVGTQSKKQTDLYYASVDGDIFPEMYYGRLSATSTQQLDNIINKILYYEKYEFTDPQYLNNVTLIAGSDSEWNPKVAQPTIKYGTANYFNTANGFTAVNEYGVASDPNNTSEQSGYTGCYNDDKISVGFINYTAHCNETKWGDPELLESNVTAFTNRAKYPLVVANCCLSGDFGTAECIGETWIRSQDRGAVTYIGSSPSSYWKEDMYWAVGAFPMVDDNNGYVPTFTESTTGAYDAPFVTPYRTAGAMVFAGNLAVTEAETQDYPRDTSSTYYWEAYNVLGDPSLMPYFTAASGNDVSHDAAVPIGVDTIKISALGGSYVSITKGSQIIGTYYFDESKIMDIPIQQVQELCNLVLTVTRPQAIPYIDTIPVIATSEPYIALSSMSINDSLANDNGKVDFGETISVNLTIKNFGLIASTNTRVLLTDYSEYATLTSGDSIFLGNISADPENNTIAIANAFTFDVSSNVPDETIETLTLTFKSDGGTWTSSLKIPINAPSIDVGEIKIDDSTLGDNSGVASPGESFYGTIALSNTGHSGISDLQAFVSIPDSVNDIVIINYEPINNVSVETGDTCTVKFRISLNPSIDESKTFPVIVNVFSDSNTAINKEGIRYVEVVPGNTITMDNQNSETCFAVFTDSGGEDSSYSNNENYVKTITAANELNKLKVVFSAFSVEEGFDKLYVYDGNSTNSRPVDGSPFTGTSLPADIYSSGQSLTFKFTSDNDIAQDGWKATISCVEPTQIPLCMANPNPANNSTGVSVKKLEWEKSSDAQFYDVYIGYDSENLAFLGRTYEPFIAVSLKKSTNYCWRVIPGNYIGICDKSCEVWNFQTTSDIDEFSMTNGTISIDSTLFYDSGGSGSNYSSNENYILTFAPKITGTKVKVAFEQFDVESNATCNYDYLKIYDGPSTSSTLIGKYCGTTLPASYTSTSSDGNLTFQFNSDENIENTGWKAKITAVGTVNLYTLTVSVLYNGLPVKNATVSINGLTMITGTTGNVQFNLPTGTFSYAVNATGYTSITGTGTINGSSKTIAVNLSRQYNSNISVFDNATNSPVHTAKVIVNGESYFTNPTGIALIETPSGSYNITIEKEGYTPENSNISISADNGTFEFGLTPEIYNISTTVKNVYNGAVPSALIAVNETSETTDSNGNASLQLPYGIHKLEVSKETYLPIEQWINVTQEAQVNIVLDYLQSEINEITYNVIGNGPLGSNPLPDANLSVYLNNSIVAQKNTNSQGRASILLPDGSYKYMLEKEGYVSSPLAEFNVEGAKIIFNDTINQITYTITFEVKSNEVAVNTAEVLLSGYYTVQTDVLGLATFSPVGYTKGLSYTVTKAGYDEYNGFVDVNSDKTVRVNLILTDVNEVADNTIKIYPNPTSGHIFIDTHLPIAQVQIIGITGYVVGAIKTNGLSTIQISTANLTRGTYITRIIFTNGKIKYSKFIKI